VCVCVCVCVCECVCVCDREGVPMVIKVSGIDGTSCLMYVWMQVSNERLGISNRCVT